MRTNVTAKNTRKTHEGAPAHALTPLQELRRSVLACLLWENQFYESGVSTAERIQALAAKVHPNELALLAIEARKEQNLRHVPLLLVRELVRNARGNPVVATTIEQVVQRADEPMELLSLYWKDGKTPIAAQLKKGLARAIAKFSEYSLAKYDRPTTVKLRDVIRLTHPAPKDEARSALYKRAVAGELETPDTWEVALSGGADKKETFERLIREGKLGYLALLRNLRNMVAAGCDLGLVREAIVARKNGADKVLPFRFVAAARACPQLEPALDTALGARVAEMPALSGVTVVLVDVSGSMGHKLSGKSDLTRMDAAAALSSVINGTVRVFSFSDHLVEVPPRRGMAGVDAVMRSQSHGGTALFQAVREVNDLVKYDRIIVISDEQAHYDQMSAAMPDPQQGAKGYVINVAAYQNGVGYGAWTHIDGFSENVLRYIHEMEAIQAA